MYLILLILASISWSYAYDMHEIFTMDCQGGLSFLPSFGANARLKTSIPKAFDWFYDRLLLRAQAMCPSLTRSQFRSYYAFTTLDFWQQAFGDKSAQPCQGLNDLSNFTKDLRDVLSNVTLTLPSGCSITNCNLQSNVFPGITLQATVKPCPLTNGGTSGWPFISLTCSGAGCETLGKFCVNDGECSSPLTCNSITDIARVVGPNSSAAICTQKRSLEDLSVLSLPLRIITSIHAGMESGNVGPLMGDLRRSYQEIEEVENAQQNSQDDCLPRSTYNQDDFTKALTNANLLDPTSEPLPCSSGAKFFGSFIDFQRNLYSPSTWASSSTITIKLCTPPLSSLNASLIETNVCNISSPSEDNYDVNCIGLQTWSGALASGVQSDDASRKNGEAFDLLIPTSPAKAAYPTENGLPVVRLFQLQCSGTVHLFPDGAQGAVIQGLASLVKYTGQAPSPPLYISKTLCDPTQCYGQNYPSSPSDPDYSCSYYYSHCVNMTDFLGSPNPGSDCVYENECANWNPRTTESSAYTSVLSTIGIANGLSASVPIYSSVVNTFYGSTAELETCRATKRGRPLTPSQFKIRFGYPLDFLLYLMTGREVDLPRTPAALGVAFSDFTSSINVSTRLNLPASCSYNRWNTSRVCSMNYTGLQPILGTEVTARVVVKECTTGAYPGLEGYVECVGRFCNLLTDAKTCSVDSDCTSKFGSGVKCIDYSSNATAGYDLMRAYFGSGLLYADPDNYFSLSKLKEDFSSLNQLFNKFDISGNANNGGNSLKICSIDLPSLFDKARTDYNVSQWEQEQFVVDGSSAVNRYLNDWKPADCPNGQPAMDCNPCAHKTCPGNPNAKCVSDPCVSCTAYSFKDSLGADVDCTCRQCSSTPQQYPCPTDATKIGGYTCDLSVCAVVPLPACPAPPDCSNACSTQSSLSCPSECTPVKTCSYVNGQCTPTLNCINCTKPPTACARTGCWGQTCAPMNAPVTCNKYTVPSASCTYQTECGFNFSTEKCDWKQNEPYQVCQQQANISNYVDECQKAPSPCHCTLNPKCAICSYSVPTGSGMFPITRCMSRSDSTCVLPIADGGLGGAFSYANCTTGVPVVDALIILAAQLPVQQLQALINGALPAAVSGKYAVVVQALLQVSNIGTSTSVSALINFKVSISGSSTPSSAEINIICQYYLSATAQTVNAKGVSCLMTLSGVQKKRSVEDTTQSTTISDYITQITLEHGSSSSVTTSSSSSSAVHLMVTFVTVIAIIAGPLLTVM